jgi:hypothetical protein
MATPSLFSKLLHPLRMLDGNAVNQNTRQQNHTALYNKLEGSIGEKLNDWNGAHRTNQ